MLLHTTCVHETIQLALCTCKNVAYYQILLLRPLLKHISLTQFDADKNGHITVLEIGNLLKLLGESVPGYKIRDMIREVDINENNTVEFNEFVEVSLLLYELMLLIFIRCTERCELVR